MNPWYYFLDLFLRNRLAVRQNALLWVLAISTEHNRPLGRMVLALAQDEGSYHWSQRLQELAKHLMAGLSLPDALDRLPGLLPADVVLAIRVGSETGTLPEMLKKTARDFSNQQDEGYATWVGTLLYLAAMVFALFSVAGFLMYYIIPKFKKIFEDFGTELPSLTKWVIEVSDAFVEWYYLIAFVVFAILAWLAWRTRQGASGGVMRWLLFSQARGQSPGLLRILSVVIEAGRPLAGAFSTMARHHRSKAVRNHLLYIRNEVGRGSEVWHLFVETGYVSRSEGRILESAERAGNLPWALRSVAERIERDVDYRLALVMEIVRPVILVGIAITVGIFVIGMFMPLIKLINDFA